ncbi:MAG: hypothetical protein HY280_07750 [Nitrospinae bacterium]|nr:hypothetical protein [Nitrospinota bacterium]
MDSFLGHLHLMVNHVPFIGFLFGVPLLAFGLKNESADLKNAAVWTFVVVAIFAIITFSTGESAEDLVKKMPGVTEQVIHAHETAGLFFLIIACIAGLVSCAILYLQKKNATVNPSLYKALFVVAVLAAIIGERTAQSGGQVRHTEIRNATLGSIAEAYEEQFDVQEPEESGMPDSKISSK